MCKCDFDMVRLLKGQFFFISRKYCGCIDKSFLCLCPTPVLLTSPSPAPGGWWSRHSCSCSRRACAFPCPAPGWYDGGTSRPSAADPASSCTSLCASPADAPAGKPQRRIRKGFTTKYEWSVATDLSDRLLIDTRAVWFTTSGETVPLQSLKGWSRDGGAITWLQGLRGSRSGLQHIDNIFSGLKQQRWWKWKQVWTDKPLDYTLWQGKNTSLSLLKINWA